MLAIEDVESEDFSEMRTLTAGALALGLIAIAASSARADIFACVNNSSGTPKFVPSCTVGTNASPCHHNDTCELIFAFRAILRHVRNPGD
jgi:hypothetical protein